MSIIFNKKHESLRAELSAWLEENLPEGWLQGRQAIPEDTLERKRYLKDWQKKLFEGGWSGISWPSEYGGRDADILQEIVYYQEMARVEAPPIINMIGINMVGPTILQMGTDFQKRRYINRMLNGEEIWCQGYSEPGAGSDLASLRTKATFRDGKWHISGQKVWTSLAHFADKCFLLARTSDTGKKHHGITAFLMDMHQPGVEVRAIRSIDDEHGFNELFLEGAVVEKSDVFGEVDQGWSAALALLSHERLSVGRQIFQLQKLFYDLIGLVMKMSGGSPDHVTDPLIRQSIGQFYSRIQALLLSYYRHVEQILTQESPGPVSSIDKLAVSELTKEIYAYAINLQGPQGILWAGDAAHSARWQKGYLRSRANSIEGGTSEIQRNIIAEQILGLPKDVKS